MYQILKISDLEISTNNLLNEICSPLKIVKIIYTILMDFHGNQNLKINYNYEIKIVFFTYY